MSRFFGAGDSASESEDLSGAEEEHQRIVEDKSTFVYDSSSDEEEKRIVRTEKDRRYDEMKKTILTMKNHIKTMDWIQVFSDYDSLLKQVDKAKNVIAKEGGLPRFYVRAMVTLEEQVVEVVKKNKASKKKLSKAKSTAVNKLRQKLKKMLKEYPKEVTEFKEARERGEDNDNDNEDGDSDDEGARGGQAGSPRSGGEGGNGENKYDDEFDDSEDWSDDFSDESEDEDVAAFGEGEGLGEITRDFWVKKVPSAEDQMRKRERRQNKPKAKKDKTDSKEEKKKELSSEDFIKKLKSLEDKRGRRGVDKKQYIEELKHLLLKAKQPSTVIKIKCILSSALFDVSMATNKAMPVALWKNCVEHLESTIEVLMSDPMIRLTEEEDVDENYEDAELSSGDEGDGFGRPQKEEKKKAEEEKEPNVTYISGNLYSFVRRLADQFTKSLQEIDPHSPLYVSRLMDEKTLLGLLTKTSEYYQMIKKVEVELKVKMLRMEIIYYHYAEDRDFQKMGAERVAAIAPKSASKRLFFGKDESSVAKLAQDLYKAREPRLMTRALLCHVYYLCIHNRVEEARSLLLMSHLQDVIHNADISTRILYNRTMAQLGLCSFRNGKFNECRQCLTDFYQSSNRLKELLAQGVTNQRYHERDLEKEKLERMRQFPYHMHMNLDMLEASCLISSMFVEVPNIAKNGFTKRKVLNRPFRKLYENHKNQAFNGPPESSRHLVMAASDALAVGDWEACNTFVMKLRMWKLIPNGAYVKEAVTQRIKEVALRVYLIVYGSQYISLDLALLTEMFALDAKTAHRIISRMMNDDTLLGAWAQPAGVILMHNQETSQLQRSSLDYADKINQFMEMNERLLDMRGSSYKGNFRGDGNKDYNKGRQRWGYRSDGKSGHENYRGRRGNQGHKGGNRRDFGK